MVCFVPMSTSRPFQGYSLILACVRFDLEILSRPFQDSGLSDVARRWQTLQVLTNIINNQTKK